ncbi:MAG TPA: glycosyltransferase family 4 protein [Candidatus Dormibacteraeota bacterium]|nr:glycosyltransferase family 4 protein [Candidatus Dormibacteraeota bacterium]
MSRIPASPPRFGAQVRIHGLMTEIARRADITAVAPVDSEFDINECRRAMGDYCEDVVLVPNPRGDDGRAKRLLQLRSMATPHSYERLRHHNPPLRDALASLIGERSFDVIDLEFPDLAHYLPARRPPLILDTHEIAHDLAHQMARGDVGLDRRVYASLNWRKVRREELAAFRAADGICACSATDERRILAEVPTARTRVIPNAADTEFYRSRPTDPAPDGRTILFFALLSTFPNHDGVLFLLREIWPRIAAARPDARLKIVGSHPPAEVLAQAGPRIEVTGFVEDLRPHIASAAVSVVPLRIGGGTRLKVVESLAMSKAIVSTRIGAEGIELKPGEEILLEDDAEAFADAVIRLLDDPALAARMGAAGRRRAEETYSWAAAASTLDGFFHELLWSRAGVPAGVS